MAGLLTVAATFASAQTTTSASTKPATAKSKTTSTAKPATAKPKTAAAKPAREPGLYTTITTSMGPVTLRMYEKESPITVKNFVDLALGNKEWTDPTTQQRVKRPLYNGLIFHRVIPGFMIQGGDPEGTGRGGTDDIPDEFNPTLTFDRPGRLAMANAGPGTGSCQFFITEAPTPHLNGRHTIFGQVVEGQAVVEKIARVPKNADDMPDTPVKMVRITFRRVGPGEQPVSSAAKPATSKAKAKPKPKTTKPATTP